MNPGNRRKPYQIPSNTPINQIHDWPSFFEQIRLRPEMWMGCKSLTALENLLSGISLAEYFYQVSDDRKLNGFDFQDFESWVNQQFNPRELSINSFSMARLSAGSDDQAFDLWFSWYDLFRSQNKSTHESWGMPGTN